MKKKEKKNKIRDNSIETNQRKWELAGRRKIKAAGGREAQSSRKLDELES